MIIRVLGYDFINFTDKQTGEVISGTKVFYESLNDDLSNTAEFGNVCDSVFLRSCPPIQVGRSYYGILRQRRMNGSLVFSLGGIGDEV